MDQLPGAAPYTPSYSSAARAHGVLMFFAFGVFMPFAVYAARYGRRFPKNGPKPWWWPSHVLLNALAILSFVAGFTISIFISGGYQWASAHKRLGLTIGVLLLIQAVWGIVMSFVHARYPARRRDTVALDWPHWIVGWSILILGIVNISLGLYLATGFLGGYSTSKTVRALWFVWMGLLVVWVVATEFFYHLKGGNQNWALSEKDLQNRYRGAEVVTN